MATVPETVTLDFDHVHLWAKGRWQKGGRVLVHDRRQQDTQPVELSPLLWATLGILIVEAQRDTAPAEDEDDWGRLATRGFVTMERLQHQLKRYLAGNRLAWGLDRQRVAKAVWKLRTILGRILKPVAPPYSPPPAAGIAPVLAVEPMRPSKVWQRDGTRPRV